MLAFQLHNFLVGLQILATDGSIDLGGLIKIIADTGTLGVLIVAVWAFVTGKILPASVVKDQMDAINKLASDTLTKTMSEAIKEAVKQGFMEAFYEVNKKD
jgi:hypothetical protein